MMVEREATQRFFTSTTMRLTVQFTLFMIVAIVISLVAAYFYLSAELHSVHFQDVHMTAQEIQRAGDQIEEMKETFLSLFMFGIMPSFLIVFIGGVFIARKTNKRVRNIQSALEAISEGEFENPNIVDDTSDDDIGQIMSAIFKMANAQKLSTAALKDVSANIAHDLKTPIQRLGVHLDDLANVENLPDDAQIPLEKALAENARIHKIFQSLLHISQIEGGIANAGFVKFDLVEMARNVADLYEISVEDNGQKLKFSSDVETCLINGDPMLVSQLITNLIENAMRHNDKGIDIHVTVTDGVLEVSDNGIGIPKSEYEKVLQRLYRMDKSRNTEGNGLGMSFVSAIAKQHDAILTLGDNEPGLSVRVKFPTL